MAHLACVIAHMLELMIASFDTQLKPSHRHYPAAVFELASILSYFFNCNLTCLYSPQGHIQVALRHALGWSRNQR
jgi:hypothetical protein